MSRTGSSIYESVKSDVKRTGQGEAGQLGVHKGATSPPASRLPRYISH